MPINQIIGLAVILPIILTMYMVGAGLDIQQKEPRLQMILKTLATVSVLAVIMTVVLVNPLLNSLVKTRWIFVFISLVLCAIGDAFLCSIKLPMFTDNANNEDEALKKKEGILFIVGMISFLLGYLTLSIGFMVIANCSPFWIIVIPTALGVIQFFTLKRVNGMHVPVIAYLLMTTVLVSGGVWMWISYGGIGAFFFFSALCYYLSDCLIAQKEFGTNFLGNKGMELVIMIIYSIGHILLIIGCSFIHLLI